MMMTTCARFCYRSVAGRGAKRGSIVRSRSGGREAAARATRIYVHAYNHSGVHCTILLYLFSIVQFCTYFLFRLLKFAKRTRPSISTFGTTVRPTNDHRLQTTRFHFAAGSSSPRHAVLRSRVRSNVLWSRRRSVLTLTPSQRL